MTDIGASKRVKYFKKISNRYIYRNLLMVLSRVSEKKYKMLIIATSSGSFTLNLYFLFFIACFISDQNFLKTLKSG